MKVVVSTSPSWNSDQAELYQRRVNPSGNQLRNQRVEKELTTTLPISASRFTTNQIVTAQIA